MIDSSSWTLPSRNQADARLASLRNLLEGKNKMAMQQSVLDDVFTCQPVRHTIWYISLCFQESYVKESNNDEIKYVCMTRFKMAP